MHVMEMDKQYIAPTYGRFPVTIEKGKGSIAWDADGKKYIDLGSGIAVNSFGFSDPEWIGAVTAQLGKIFMRCVVLNGRIIHLVNDVG